MGWKVPVPRVAATVSIIGRGLITDSSSHLREATAPQVTIALIGSPNAGGEI